MTPVQAASEDGFTIEGKSAIAMFHLLQLKYALMLEIRGMKHSRGSVYAYVKRTFGFRGDKQKVLDLLVARIKKLQQERAANDK